MSAPDPSQRSQSSPWVAPPFLLTAVLVVLGFGVSWGVWTTVVDGLRAARAEDRASINVCLKDVDALKLRVNTLENENQGRERLWLAKWETIDSRSQRIEAMLEELLRGRSRSSSYR